MCVFTWNRNHLITKIDFSNIISWAILTLHCSTNFWQVFFYLGLQNLNLGHLSQVHVTVTDRYKSNYNYCFAWLNNSLFCGTWVWLFSACFLFTGFSWFVLWRVYICYTVKVVLYCVIEFSLKVRDYLSLCVKWGRPLNGNYIFRIIDLLYFFKGYWLGRKGRQRSSVGTFLFIKRNMLNQ
jgi:hypothetical protein